MSTTKRQIERIVLEVDVLCDLAAMNVRSHMPTGLGAEFSAEGKALEATLEDIPRRFKRAVRKAQKQGWASK